MFREPNEKLDLLAKLSEKKLLKNSARKLFHRKGSSENCARRLLGQVNKNIQEHSKISIEWKQNN